MVDYHYPYNRQPQGLRIASRQLPAEVEQQLRDQIWEAIITGLSSPIEFSDTYAPDYAEHLSVAELEAVVSELMDARRAQQAVWGPEVAQTNLVKAFDELNARGILALADFTCCSSCAAAEVRDELDPTDPQFMYLYFHHQNTERFATTGRGWVGFGSVLGALGVTREDWESYSDVERDELYERATVELLRRHVLPVFESHGIEVIWDGTTASNLELVGADYYHPLD